MGWQTIDNAPEARYVMTKIDDEKGCRNMTHLKRHGGLWFAGDMYMYYTPTHWRELTAEERSSRTVVVGQRVPLD